MFIANMICKSCILLQHHEIFILNMIYKSSILLQNHEMFIPNMIYKSCILLQLFWASSVFMEVLARNGMF